MAGKRSWVVVVLSPKGEKEIDDVPRIIRECLNSPDAEVFTPIFCPTDTLCKEKVHLMDGYVFCRSTCNGDTFFNLEEDDHFRSILTRDEAGFRQIEYISDAKIKSLKNQLAHLVSKDLKEGDTVEILDGTCKYLKGSVLSLTEELATVSITDLKSTDLVIELPLSSLRKLVKKKSFEDLF